MIHTLDRYQAGLRTQQLNSFRKSKIVARTMARENERQTYRIDTKPQFSHTNPPSARKPVPPAHTRRQSSPRSPPAHDPRSFVSSIRAGVLDPPPSQPNPVRILGLAVRGHASTKIPSNMGYSFDLLFSINMTGDTKSLSSQGFKMQSLNIFHPIMPLKSPGAPHIGTLLASSRLDNARMLNNLRWNPFVSPVTIRSIRQLWYR
jgi:hypothetical protein